MDNIKDNKWSCLIILLLVIIILVLLYFVKFEKIQHELTPTGNVDVFNIDIDCDCDCDSNSDNNQKPNSTSDDTNNKKEVIVDGNGGYKVIPVYNEDDKKDYLGKIFISDKNGNYVYQQNLKIFENAAFEYKNIIAPGTSNTYQFVVHNNMNIDLNYNIKMYEVSKYNINLKYRLRKNGKYVIGNDKKWVSADELKTDFSKIKSDASDKYSLDWKWPYEGGKDNEDTKAGRNMSSAYKLNVGFYFEQVN